MTTVLIPTFRYDCFCPEMAEALRETAIRIRAQIRTATKAVIAIGHELISIKGQLDHGQFTRWVEIECGFSLRSAENYMRAAVFVGRKSETVSFLRPATIYRLAAKNAPPEVVAAVVERFDTGPTLTDSEIMVMLEEAQRRKRSVGALARPLQHNSRTVELATEIMNGLGPEVARELVAVWEAVGESLRKLVETRTSQVVGAAVDTADESSESGCENLQQPPALTPAFELMADSRDGTLSQPKATIPKTDDDYSDLPPFLDRSKNGIGREASGSQVP